MTGRVLEFLNRAQDRVTGDYSPFWQARDYLSRVGGVEANVFVVHGLNDWNVNTKAFAEWWYRLADRRVPRKVWFHNGGHGPPRGDGAALYKLAENHWFDYWLLGVPNGITEEPRSTISARTAPITRRPTGRRPGHASRGSTSRLAPRPHPATSRLDGGDGVRTRASSTGAGSSTRTTC
jgi:X-Pro dipeptidyl-peptidase